MPVLSRSERDAFLAEREIVMRIAVVRGDGSPLVTPIWFLHEDDAIYFTPREQSEWFACLRRDRRAALCIDEQPLPGTVTVSVYVPAVETTGFCRMDEKLLGPKPAENPLDLLIAKRPDDHGSHFSGNGLQAQILGRMSGFHMNVA